MRTVLTIAGSDCSGGAGIQADLKTITAHKLYGMSVVTVLTAQNSTGVYGLSHVAPAFVVQQMDCVLEDIPPDAVKIGMVGSEAVISAVADRLTHYKAAHVVLDPVMISTSGSRLLDEGALKALRTKLFPLAEVITPNIPEASCLCGFAIETHTDMVRAAERISEAYDGHILIKGGHRQGKADDLLFRQGAVTWFSGERIANGNTHGTGCTLSSAIACGLAQGLSVTKSVERAKAYITLTLKAQLNLGKGRGPLNHSVL